MSSLGFYVGMHLHVRADTQDYTHHISLLTYPRQTEHTLALVSLPWQNSNAKAKSY